MNTLLILLLAAVVATATADSKAKCNLNELENNIAKITGYLLDNDYFYPSSDADFEKYCSNIKSGAKYSKDYAKRCLKNSPKTILSVFSYSSTQTNKKYCNRKNAPARKEILQFGKCLNANKKLTNACFQDYVNKVNATNSMTRSKNKLVYLCCNTSEFKRCILDGLADSKVPSCTEPVLEIYEKYVDSIYSNIINSICDGNEESTDRCKKLSKNVKITSKRFDHITAFPAIFEVFENL